MLTSTHIRLSHTSTAAVSEKIRSVLDTYAGSIDYVLNQSRCVYMCKQLTPRGFLREDFVHIIENDDSGTVTVEVRRIFGDGLLFERDKDMIDIWASLQRSLSNESGASQSRSHLFDSRADWFTSMPRESDDSLDCGELRLPADRAACDAAGDATCDTAIDLPLIEHLVYSPSEETKWEGIQLLCTALYELLCKVTADGSTQGSVLSSFDKSLPRIMKMLEEVFIPVDFLPLLEEDIIILRDAVSNSTPLSHDTVCSRRGEFLTTRMSRAADMKELRFYFTPAMEVGYVVVSHVLQFIGQYPDETDAYANINEAKWLPPYLDSTCEWIDLNAHLFPELSYSYAAVLRAVRVSRLQMSNISGK